MISSAHPSLAKTPALPELPPAGESVEALSLEVREALGGFWQARAQRELTAVGVFADVARTLCTAGADQELLWLASRALTDELRHSMLCRHVAAIYWQRPAPVPVPLAIDAPHFGDAPPEVNHLLYIVLHCCVNETMASAHLRAALKAAESPLVREVTRLLLADEVDHARVGWAHLASNQVSAGLRDHVGRALPALLRVLERLWFRDKPSFAVSVPPGHGFLDDGEAMAVTLDALHTLIFPGFERVKVDTGLGKRWWQQRSAELGLA